MYYSSLALMQPRKCRHHYMFPGNPINLGWLEYWHYSQIISHIASSKQTLYSRFGFSTRQNQNTFEFLAYLALGIFNSGTDWTSNHTDKWCLDILPLRSTSMSSIIHSWIGIETLTFLSKVIICLLCIRLVCDQLSFPYIGL